MAFKLLIASESNAGKTTLLKDLKDTLVISHDGKKFPFPIPHKEVEKFGSVTELAETVIAATKAYKEKYEEKPKTIAFDAVSRIMETIHKNCLKNYGGYEVYNNLEKEIHLFNDFIEQTLINSGINVIIISHALYEPDTGKYNLVGKGSFNKIGGMLGVVHESIFIEIFNNQRILHYKHPKFIARTLQPNLPDNIPLSEFNLQTHMELIQDSFSEAEKFAL